MDRTDRDVLTYWFWAVVLAILLATAVCTPQPAEAQTQINIGPAPAGWGRTPAEARAAVRVARQPAGYTTCAPPINHWWTTEGRELPKACGWTPPAWFNAAQPREPGFYLGTRRCAPHCYDGDLNIVLTDCNLAPAHPGCENR